MRRNALLAAVEASNWGLVEASGAIVAMDPGACVQEAGAPLKQVYFPISGAITIGAETLDGEIVNVAIVGREGSVGAIEACGSQQSHAQARVLVAGSAVRMPAAAYRTLFHASEALRSGLHLYTEALLAESRVSIACNALHTVEMRLAKTLLLLSDRLGGSPELPVIQEALSQLLGVQRTTVSAVLAGLQDQGVVRQRRGAVDILDAGGLERAACSCRGASAFAVQEIQASPSCACA